MAGGFKQYVKDILVDFEKEQVIAATRAYI